MSRFNSLKYRIITASFAMTFMVCLLFSLGLFVSFDIAEESFLEEHIYADMSTFVKVYNQYPGIVALPRDDFVVFVSTNNDDSQLPPYLQNLSEDVDDIEVDGELRNLEILQQGNTRFYFLTEETAMDEFEAMLVTSVIVIIAIICLTAMMLGFAFANRIIKPVTNLASKVNKLERKDHTMDGTELTGMDEIEILSHAIDSFQLRVSELLNRERDFSSDASHELRTPLMGIQAAAENIKVSSVDSERVMQLALRIEERCKQMQSLIDSMLYLARDSHSLENDFSDIRLLDIVNDQLESAAPYIENKGIVTRIINNASPFVFSSPAILRVVFGNLLKNAVLHSESREIHIELFEHGFRIQDFGDGIPGELKDNLFQRTSNGGGKIDQSNGIGLSLVKRLCDHFAWQLTVDSSPRVGTTITVIFEN